MFSFEHVIEGWVRIHESWEIYSIKRLSDGEIFSIGDDIKPIDTTEEWIRSAKIERFEIYQNTILTHFKNGILFSRTIDKLNKLEEKIPLFVTEDNIKIYKNDKYFKLNTYNWNSWEEIASIKPNWSNGFKCFSTKEKAKEYKEMNIKKFSTQDILDALEATKYKALRINQLDVERFKKKLEI